MTLYLSKQEIDTLAALEDLKDRGAVELAQLLDFPPYAMRSIVQALRQRRLIERAHSLIDVGKWHITDAGLRELNDRRQLRLVK